LPEPSLTPTKGLIVQLPRTEVKEYLAQSLNPDGVKVTSVKANVDEYFPWADTEPGTLRVGVGQMVKERKEGPLICKAKLSLSRKPLSKGVSITHPAQIKFNDDIPLEYVDPETKNISESARVQLVVVFLVPTGRTDGLFVGSIK
jgi:hypothetical protein